VPKMRTELTPERDTEIQRRSDRARAAIKPPPARTETTHATASKAKTAASRCGLPNTEIGAIETTHGWVGVVILRNDQAWMAPIVREHGCRVGAFNG
jgi:hypothetical protein